MDSTKHDNMTSLQLKHIFNLTASSWGLIWHARLTSELFSQNLYSALMFRVSLDNKIVALRPGMTWDGEYFPRQFGQPKSVNSRQLYYEARHREATGLIFQHATSPVIVKNEIFSSPPQ